MFPDPICKTIKERFIPWWWLRSSASAQLQSFITSRTNNRARDLGHHFIFPIPPECHKSGSFNTHRRSSLFFIKLNYSRIEELKEPLIIFELVPFISLDRLFKHFKVCTRITARGAGSIPSEGICPATIERSFVT